MVCASLNDVCFAPALRPSVLFSEVLYHVEVQDNDRHGDRNRGVVHSSSVVACLVYQRLDKNKFLLVHREHKQCV